MISPLPKSYYLHNLSVKIAVDNDQQINYNSSYLHIDFTTVPVTKYCILKMNQYQDEIHDFCSLHPGETEQSDKTFQWVDFLVFGIVLGISAVIGIVFAFVDRNKTSDEYMMGGGNVNPGPIAMSLATTFFSAITVLGTPVEYYNYGTMFTYFIVCYFLCTVLAAEVFGPMYKEFGLTSLYGYLGVVLAYLHTIIYRQRNICKQFPIS